MTKLSGRASWEGITPPQSLRRLEIPKPDGGVKLLGMPITNF